MLWKLINMNKGIKSAFQKETGYSLTVFFILDALQKQSNEKKVSSSSSVSVDTGSDRSTTSSILLRMERNGLVANKKLREDQRVHIHELTPDGVKLLKRLRQTYAKLCLEVTDCTKQLGFAEGVEMVISRYRPAKKGHE